MPHLNWSWALVVAGYCLCYGYPPAACATDAEIKKNVLAVDQLAPSQLEQAFIEVALKNEYGPPRMRVRKWMTPISVWVAHDPVALTAEQREMEGQHTKLVQWHLQHLAMLTGVSMTMASAAETANFHIRFSDSATWHRAVQHVSGQPKLMPPADATCMFGMRPDTNQVIRHAWVVIPVDLATEHRALLTCIVEEITQALGLPNDTDQVYPSIFNDHSPDILLTSIDTLLLQLLYHPRVRAGMTEAEVRPIVRQLLLRWQQDGTLALAAARARQTPLFSIMGYE